MAELLGSGKEFRPRGSLSFAMEPKLNLGVSGFGGNRTAQILRLRGKCARARRLLMVGRGMTDRAQSLSFAPEDRLTAYRHLAAQAYASAAAATAPEARDTFIAIASAWEALIQEMMRAVEDLNPDATLPLHNRFGSSNQYTDNAK
jgi:hypothetical protein